MEKSSKFEGKFEVLEHTADIYLAAYGASLEEAFGSAALAMFETMTDTTKIAPAQKEVVEVEAEDEYALLYSWLEALLVKFEVNGMMYSQFNVESIKDCKDGFKLKATVCGEPFNPKTPPKGRRKSHHLPPNGIHQDPRKGNLDVSTRHLT